MSVSVYVKPRIFSVCIIMLGRGGNVWRTPCMFVIYVGVITLPLRGEWIQQVLCIFQLWTRFQDTSSHAKIFLYNIKKVCFYVIKKYFGVGGSILKALAKKNVSKCFFQFHHLAGHSKDLLMNRP